MLAISNKFLKNSPCGWYRFTCIFDVDTYYWNPESNTGDCQDWTICGDGTYEGYRGYVGGESGGSITWANNNCGTCNESSVNQVCYDYFYCG